MVNTKTGTNLLFLRDEDLRQGVELLFFAHKDFSEEADQILKKYNFGRAHHRVIYFVGQHPLIKINDLLSILSITKQSLSRVLNKLIEKQYINITINPKDKRQRMLELTDSGQELEKTLSNKQLERISTAYQLAGAEAVEGFQKVMIEIMKPDDQKYFDTDTPEK
jgi:DNA-binding MarR family transcriptional regulator